MVYSFHPPSPICGPEPIVPDVLHMAWVGVKCPEPNFFVTLFAASVHLRPAQIVLHLSHMHWIHAPCNYTRTFHDPASCREPACRAHPPNGPISELLRALGVTVLDLAPSDRKSPFRQAVGDFTHAALAKNALSRGWEGTPEDCHRRRKKEGCSRRTIPAYILRYQLPDLVRMWALHRLGGVYLDSDILVLDRRLWQWRRCPAAMTTATWYLPDLNQSFDGGWQDKLTVNSGATFMVPGTAFGRAWWNYTSRWRGDVSAQGVCCGMPTTYERDHASELVGMQDVRLLPYRLCKKREKCLGHAEAWHARLERIASGPDAAVAVHATNMASRGLAVVNAVLQWVTRRAAAARRADEVARLEWALRLVLRMVQFRYGRLGSHTAAEWRTDTYEAIVAA